jgi:hypothetical protein
VYALSGFEPHGEGGGSPYWMPVLSGVLRTPAPGAIGGHAQVCQPGLGSGWGRAPSLTSGAPVHRPQRLRESMRSLLTRVATALGIKLVDSDDSPSVPISAEFREALQESWASLPPTPIPLILWFQKETKGLD